METFAPEFASYWPSSQSRDAGGADFDRDDGDTPTQQAALEELAGRVSAARSVV